MSIRLSPALRRALTELARAHGRTVAEEAHYSLCVFLGAQYAAPRIGASAAPQMERQRRAKAAAAARWA